MADTPAPAIDATTAAALPEHRWVRFVPWIILAGAVLAVILVATRWDRVEADRSVQSTDNATVQADTAVINARTAGYVRRVAFTDFQRVHAGDLLVEIDDREPRAAVARAEAALLKAQASLANLDGELAAQQATIAQASANAEAGASRLALAIEDNRRFQGLATSGAVTGQEEDSARTNVAVVRAGVAGNAAALDLQRRQLGVLKGQRPAREADVLAARAALDTARIQLSYTRIVAPADGTIGQRLIQPGSLLNPGTAVVNFVALTTPYVVANYKETQLGRIAPGQAVEIGVDSFPGERLRGRVSRLAPASGATFAALPADNATGNFTKVTQRVPLRIDFDGGQPLVARLRAGMSVTTRVHTRD